MAEKKGKAPVRGKVPSRPPSAAVWSAPGYAGFERKRLLEPQLPPAPADKAAQASEIDMFARSALIILKWAWLGDDLSIEARRVLPLLLLELYLAAKTEKRISKKQACDIMGVDYAKTGPKYIAHAEAKGLIEIDRKPSEDRRKDFLKATPQLVTMLKQELKLLSRLVAETRRQSTIPDSPESAEDTVGLGELVGLPELQDTRERLALARFIEGQVCEARGETALAKELYERALQLDPNARFAAAKLVALKASGT